VRARVAEGAPTPRERDWIEALSLFFEHFDTLDQKTRTAKYEAAMAKLHEQYPQDTEAAVFYALALKRGGRSGGQVLFASAAGLVLEHVSTVRRD